MRHLTSILVVMSLLTGCVIAVPDEEGDDQSSDSSPPPSYENRVYLECNGNVLVDRVFTSKPACLDFASSNTFYCGPIKLPISC